jgi:hypothetical protein
MSIRKLCEKIWIYNLMVWKHYDCVVLQQWQCCI